MEKEDKNIVTIDAEGQSLGRMASRIAMVLQDKHKPEYAPNKVGETSVVIENLSKIKPFKETKLRTKIYYKHTGYIGHLRETKLSDMWEKDPEKVLRMAVRGMLPKNKLRDKRLKRLEIHLLKN
ncbi:MAG TPA: 50S ribosomal protein L13 [Candidatus Paceibacterota bacterium]|nr:50S ribosomal protein L13 [Candidatus Paceibacterota bacterium]